MENTQQKLVTDSQMARILRVRVSWLRAEAEAKRIPSVNADGRYLFHRDTVVQVLADRAASGDTV